MIRKIMIPILSSVAIFFGIAIFMILSQWPSDIGVGKGLDFTNQLTARMEPAALTSVEMMDGYALQHRYYPAEVPNAPLIVLVHGSGWHGMQFDMLARALQSQATVVVPDLRGHGTAPGVRGDIAYLGQFEDDLAELIKAYAKPGQKIVLGGHSSGGGLTVRFAGGSHGDLLDGVILMAPYLKYNAPTTKTNSGGWAQPLTRRLVGVSMLNMVGIHALDHLTVIQFRMPQVVMEGPLGPTATTAYTHRLNASFAPRNDYEKDLAALPPFVLIAGTQDEAFEAIMYEPVISAQAKNGHYQLVEGIGHLDIVDAPETTQAIQAFLSGL